MKPADPGAYRYRDRQVGRSRWQRVVVATLPPPRCDEAVSMQRFAQPTPHLGEVHVVDLVLDFDAHAPWLTVEHARREALAVLALLERRYGLSPEQVGIAYSGRNGFHLTLAAPLLGWWESAQATAAAKALASEWRRAARLVTLDAPILAPGRGTTCRPQDPDAATLDAWREALVALLGEVPVALADAEALWRWIQRSGTSFFTRRRLIRRLNSPRHGGGWKIPLTIADLEAGMDRIRALATAPRPVGPRTAAVSCAPLAEAYATLLAAQEQESAHRRGGGTVLRPAAPPPPRPVPLRPRSLTFARAGGVAPPCIARLAQRPPPPGASNPELVTMAAYMRAVGVAPADAIAAMVTWAGDHRDESVRSVVRTVYTHGYAFGYPFVAALGVVTPADCHSCPFRTFFARCWGNRTTVE